MPENKSPTPDENDLILVADTGKIFLIKMKPDGDGNMPSSISELPPETADVVTALRDANATLAILPDEPDGGGATCTLLNMMSIKPALNPKGRVAMTQTQKSIIDATRAIKEGHDVAIMKTDGTKVSLPFGQTPAK